MKKLADISQFERLQGDSGTASDVSVFNGKCTDEVVEAFKNKALRDPEHNWRNVHPREIGIFLGQRIYDAIKNGNIPLKNYSLGDLLYFIQGEVSDALYALDEVEEVKLPRNSLDSQGTAVYLVLHKLAADGVGEWGKE